MKVLDFLKTIGTTALSVHPAGAAALTLVNQFLPDEKKLSVASSGDDAIKAVEQLSSADQAKIKLAEVNLEKVELLTDAEKYQAMCKADGQTTRAKIVDKAMNCLIIVSLIFIASVAYVYSTKGAGIAFSYEMMAVYLAVSGTFAYVVRAYFGDLRSETESRHLSINNRSPNMKGIAGIIGSLTNKK
ncbi:hypothetical protein [Glaciecola sp. KUL10]|uniref:hypothetical protein n=1 Tax=Glaciecola sp. (strain KUL10) TaxID=2161813 RepID=UPI000D789AC7|nr:hypothetical protein [Glaciecola sp. KUL10]